MEPLRLLGQSEHLLRCRDFSGCRSYALRARQCNPNLAGSDQILAISDVLSSAGDGDGALDPYSVLGLDPRCDDRDLMRSRFKRLILLLNPSKNKFAFAGEAFSRVNDAWSVLSNAAKKARYDAVSGRAENPRKEGPPAEAHCGDFGNGVGGLSCEGTFWTVCPYCYYVYEYARVYEDCCLRCQTCRRPFHGAPIASPPVEIPGKDAYRCLVGFFPLGFKAPEGGEEDQKEGEFGANMDCQEKERVVVEISDENEEELEGGSVDMAAAEKVETEHQRSDEQSKEVPNVSNRPLRIRKTVAKNTKKIMGRGIKRNEVREVLGREDGGEPGFGTDGGMEKGDWEWMGCEFFAGDDDIFVSVPDTAMHG